MNAAAHADAAGAAAVAAGPLSHAELRPSLQLYNTMSRKKEPFTTRADTPNTVQMYVCGVTVYDYSHIGTRLGGPRHASCARAPGQRSRTLQHPGRARAPSASPCRRSAALPCAARQATGLRRLHMLAPRRPRARVRGV